jgi:signal transduction histidine kinase/ActR/RegA family two-component response regulator
MSKRSGSEATDGSDAVRTSKQANPTLLLGAEGITAELIRGIDWSKTALGSSAQWPRSLTSLVSTMIHSRHPMFLWWGPELVQFYNDAYLPSFGAGKHPRAMGQRGRECWPEIWSIIAPQIEDVMLRAKASWNEDALVPIQRNGRIEEVYWTYGYSPAFDDDGNVGGTLVVCTETTPRVLSARRADLVRLVNEGLAACAEPSEIIPATEAVLHVAGIDVPFFEVRALSASPTLARRSEQVIELEAPRARAPWPEPVSQAFEITCRAPAARLTFGLSPRLSFDARYLEFLRQIVEQIEHASARIQAFRVRAVAEAERRNLIMQAPVATALLTGPRHVFELTNPHYQEMIGGRDVLGKPYVEAFPEVAGSEIEQILDRVYHNGEPYFAEEYLLRLNRHGHGPEDVYFRFNLEPVRDSEGQVFGVMAVALDVTAQVTARRVVEKSAAEREKLLASLEAASRAKDEFLATVSHELRTPLTSILGWARLLNDSSEPGRVKKGIAVIERNAKAQAQLIEDILDVSRIVSGKVRLNMAKLEPAAVIRAAVETVRPLADAKQQELRISIEHPLPMITGDEDRLQQVVWNLLSNAVKFTPPGGRIEVQASAFDDSLKITISDDGAGISAAFLPHVFDRFRQDDNSTTKQHGGLGLGLSIVRHLTELHGGTVTVASSGLGQGACFSVVLPLRPATPTSMLYSSGPPDQARSSSGASRALLAGTRLLVVDDQDDARELLVTVLEDAGALVKQANSVRAALAALATHPTDLVISDIGMPDEDGYSFIARLRAASPPISELPAVAVTAFARAEDRARALNAGFNEHISKPIDPRALVEVAARFAASREK